MSISQLNIFFGPTKPSPRLFTCTCMFRAYDKFLSILDESIETLVISAKQKMWSYRENAHNVAGYHIYLQR